MTKIQNKRPSAGFAFETFGHLNFEFVSNFSFRYSDLKYLSTLPAAAMPAEHSRRAELAKLMAHHIFGNQNSVKDFSIVNQKHSPNELGHYRARPPPRLDGVVVARVDSFLNLLVKLFVNVWAFFCASGHYSNPVYARCLRAPIARSVCCVCDA